MIAFASPGAESENVYLEIGMLLLNEGGCVVSAKSFFFFFTLE